MRGTIELYMDPLTVGYFFPNKNFVKPLLLQFHFAQVLGDSPKVLEGMLVSGPKNLLPQMDKLPASPTVLMM